MREHRDEVTTSGESFGEFVGDAVNAPSFVARSRQVVCHHGDAYRS